MLGYICKIAFLLTNTCPQRYRREGWREKANFKTGIPRRNFNREFVVWFPGTLCEKNSFECVCDLVELPLRPIFRRNWEKFLCESGRSDYRYIWALWAFHVMNWYSEVGGKLELDTERKGIVNAQGRIPLPNRMNFWKNSKRPLTPLPPHLWKIMLQIFYNGYGRIYARRHRPDSLS